MAETPGVTGLMMRPNPSLSLTYGRKYCSLWFHPIDESVPCLSLTTDLSSESIFTGSDSREDSIVSEDTFGSEVYCGLRAEKLLPKWDCGSTPCFFTYFLTCSSTAIALTAGASLCIIVKRSGSCFFSANCTDCCFLLFTHLRLLYEASRSGSEFIVSISEPESSSEEVA